MNWVGIKHRISPRMAVQVLEGVLLCVVVGLLVLVGLRLLTPTGPTGAIGGDFDGRSRAGIQMPAIDIFWPAKQLSQSVQIGDWVLFGVYFRKDNPSAILAQGKRGEQMVFRPGDALDEGTQLSEIGSDFVVLSMNGRQTRLYLDDAIPAQGASDTDAPKLALRATEVVLPGPLDPALLEPYGLQAGDVLLAVNGEKVQTLADLKSFAALQQSGQSVRVKIRRGNETLEKVLRQ